MYRISPAPLDQYWQPEGIVFHVSPIQLAYTVPLYSLAKGSIEDYFLTTDAGERSQCLQYLGYKDNGVIGYVLPPQMDVPGTTSIYRWVRTYTPPYYYDLQDHFYTSSSEAIPDYKFEGMRFRVWTEVVRLPKSLVKVSIPKAGAAIKSGSLVSISWTVWSSGGLIRLSFSTDNAQSWQPITTLPNNGGYGQLNTQSYNSWKVPAGTLGTLRIKVDWLRSDSSGNPSGLPWATHISSPIKAVTSASSPVRRTLSPL